MKAKMRTNGTEPNETAALAAAGEAAEPAATVSPGTGRLARFRPRLGVGSRFARHLLEMVIGMIGGMAVLGAALGALGEPPGYANPFVEYGLSLAEAFEFFGATR